jgi:predicted RNA-binding Zn-ribbon protein involved in translation (DUF1610 family)
MANVQVHALTCTGCGSSLKPKPNDPLCICPHCGVGNVISMETSGHFWGEISPPTPAPYSYQPQPVAKDDSLGTWAVVSLFLFNFFGIIPLILGIIARKKNKESSKALAVIVISIVEMVLIVAVYGIVIYLAYQNGSFDELWR